MMLTRWRKTGVAVALAGAVATGGTALADNAINPYTDKGASYELPLRSDIPQGERIEIAKDRAAITLHAWNDEEAITITPQVPQSAALGRATKVAFSAASRPLLSKRMEFRSGDATAFIEPTDDPSKFDIDFTLNAKPATNIFTYVIEGAEDLDFFYQPTPTQQEIDEGVRRPDNVVGSYAVYSKANTNHSAGQTNYATGKIMHIYRPKAIDAHSQEMWADLSFTDGLLSVTVPQKFLDEAIYPVRIDPTFGNTAIGGTEFILGSGDEVDSTHSVIGAAGTVTDISYYGRRLTTNRGTRGGLYAVTSAAFVQGGSEVTINSTTPQWWTSTGLSAAVTAQNYYVAIYADGVVGGDNISYYFDTVAAANRASQGSLTYPSWPDPVSVISSARKISAYATYTAAGGGSAPPKPDDGFIPFE